MHKDQKWLTAPFKTPQNAKNPKRSARYRNSGRF
jgi:hypothetical protein